MLLAAAAGYALTRAQDAVAVADDPARIAERALDQKFNAAVAEREIEAALAANDSDLAQSFVDLAAARHVALEPATVAKVNAAVAEAATPRHKAESFARGLVTGEPDDMAALAGTAIGDLFVFGDIRDAVRESARLASGEKADELVLGLACVGIAITAGTYASFGAAAPVRVGLTLAKAARKAGGVGAKFAGGVGRLLRNAVDWGALQTACRSRSRRWRCARCARRSRSSAPAGSCISRATSAACRRKPARAPRSTASRSPRSRRDMARLAQARREGRQPHPRHFEGGGTRRDLACRRRLRHRDLDSGRAVHSVRLRLLAQERDRAHHVAHPATPQAPPRALGSRDGASLNRVDARKRHSHRFRL